MADAGTMVGVQKSKIGMLPGCVEVSLADCAQRNNLLDQVNLDGKGSVKNCVLSVQLLLRA